MVIDNRELGLGKGLGLVISILYRTRNTFYGTWVSAQPRLVTWCNVELGGAENAGPENAGPENDGPNWILVNLNISGNSPCGSEVGHQI
jgi:hypothetical protein